MTTQGKGGLPRAAAPSPFQTLGGGSGQPEGSTDHTASRPRSQSDPGDVQPRWRASSIGETAMLAALHQRQTHKAPTLRVATLEEIERAPSIPEEILVRLRERGVRTVLTSVRPRCSELARLGLIKDSGARRKGEGGCNAIVWSATSEEERAIFNARKALDDEKGPGGG